MSQYQANTGTQAQAHKPGMVDKVKAKAEGMVGKITGHHTGTTTGTTAGTTAGTTTGMGGPGHNQGYGHQQPQEQGYGHSAPGADQTYGEHTQGYGQSTEGYGQQHQQQPGAGNQGYAQQQPGGANPYIQQQPMGGNTAAHGQQHPSMMDKVKAVITPGHQSDTVGAGHGTGTGHHAATATTTGQGATGLSTTDKIKNMLPGHHNKTSGTGTGYN